MLKIDKVTNRNIKYMNYLIKYSYEEYAMKIGGAIVKGKESSIVSELIKVGLNKYEAMVYITLLQNPEITAYEIGKRSGVPQSKIYDTVKELVNKCIVILNGSDPIKYVAIPLEEFLDRYKRETEHTIDYLKEHIKDISNAQIADYMWHFNGKDQTNGKIKKMIENANGSIYLDIWAEDYEFIYEDLLAAHNRGVDVVSVIYGDIKNEIGKVYYHEMYGIDEDVKRHGKWLSLVVDDSECLFGILKGDESSGIWTQNKAFMLVTECFITHDIYISEIYLKYKDLLDKEFGYNLEKIRKKIHIG